MEKKLKDKIIEILKTPRLFLCPEKQHNFIVDRISEEIAKWGIIPKTATLCIGKKIETAEKVVKRINMEQEVLEEIREFEESYEVDDYRTKILYWQNKLKK